MKIIPILLLFPILIISCTKKEEAIQTPKVVSLNIKAFSMGNAIELLHQDVVIATVDADLGYDRSVVLNIQDDQEPIIIRKKEGREKLGELQVNAAPFKQSKMIYFDGKMLIDNLELTPPANPANMGFRICFNSAYPHFYGGPVDIELFEEHWDMNTFEITYHPMGIIIPSVSASFSGFYELQEPLNTPELLISYKFKVYKAGTKEPAYTPDADLSWMTDPLNNYGSIYFMPGESQLLVTDFYFDGAALMDSYNVSDIGTLFK